MSYWQVVPVVWKVDCYYEMICSLIINLLGTVGSWPQQCDFFIFLLHTKRCCHGKDCWTIQHRSKDTGTLSSSRDKITAVPLLSFQENGWVSFSLKSWKYFYFFNFFLTSFKEVCLFCLSSEWSFQKLNDFH